MALFLEVHIYTLTKPLIRCICWNCDCHDIAVLHIACWYTPTQAWWKRKISYPAPGFYTVGSDEWYHKIVRATGGETQTCFSSLFPQGVFDGHVPDEFGLKHQGWLKAQLFPCLLLSEVRLTKLLGCAHKRSCKLAHQKDSPTQRWAMPGRQLLTTSFCQKPQNWKSSC